MSGKPGSIQGLAKCSGCGHFASVHHGSGGGRPDGSTCAAPDCDCTRFIEPNDARVPLGVDRLTAAEVAQLTGLSVHTLNYWRQSGQGPKSIKAGTRTLYPRPEVERWLAEIDGHTVPSSRPHQGGSRRQSRRRSRSHRNTLHRGSVPVRMPCWPSPKLFWPNSPRGETAHGHLPAVTLQPKCSPPTMSPR